MPHGTSSIRNDYKRKISYGWPNNKMMTESPYST